METQSAAAILNFFNISCAARVFDPSERVFKVRLKFNHSKRFVNLRDYSRARICVKSSVKKWNYLEFFGIFAAKISHLSIDKR